jgi:hypothetical protein
VGTWQGPEAVEGGANQGGTARAREPGHAQHEVMSVRYPWSRGVVAVHGAARLAVHDAIGLAGQGGAWATRQKARR